MADHYTRYQLLSRLFPNQTRSIPSILIWTLVFFADIAIVLWAAYLLGFTILDTVNNQGLLIIYLVIAACLFCIESFLYNLIKG